MKAPVSCRGPPFSTRAEHDRRWRIDHRAAGVGWELAISRELARAMNGDLTVESTLARDRASRSRSLADATRGGAVGSHRLSRIPFRHAWACPSSIPPRAHPDSPHGPPRRAERCIDHLVSDERSFTARAMSRPPAPNTFEGCSAELISASRCGAIQHQKGRPMSVDFKCTTCQASTVR